MEHAWEETRPKMSRWLLLLAALCALAGIGRSHDEFGVPAHPSNTPVFEQLAAPVGPPVLIHGGVVVNADGQFAADVLMENGIIVAVGSNLHAPSNAIRLDASGKYGNARELPALQLCVIQRSGTSCRVALSPTPTLKCPSWAKKRVMTFSAGKLRR